MSATVSDFPAGAARPKNERPVAAVGPHRLAVGDYAVPYYTGSLRHALPPETVTRIVIVLHGRLRDADAYLESALHALRVAGDAAAHTLLFVPQFLATADIAAHTQPEDTLHWEWTAWMGGDDAAGPAPISAFDVLDASVAHCLDSALFPKLQEIVIAGHSGGAQVAHRYAIVGRAAKLATARGIACRYVIANPSSYVYFDAFRPAPCADCPGFNDWKYGVNVPPRYAADIDFDRCAEEYANAEVIYLLGSLDCDPTHQALDRSCAARTQGPHRLARGRAYFDYLQRRFPALRHRCEEIPGVGHHGQQMLASVAGIRALFDVTVTPDDIRRANEAGGGAAD